MLKAEPEEPIPPSVPNNTSKQSKILIEITVDDLNWDAASFDYREISNRALELIFKKLKLHPIRSPLEISLLLTNDEAITQLNADFRGINKPTNTLSFPSFSDKEECLRAFADYNKKPQNTKKSTPIPSMEENLFLGDVAISYQTMHREAVAANITFAEHYTHLFLHSILHLLGYDHIEKEDALEMMNLEIELLADLGIQNPYAADIYDINLNIKKDEHI